MINPNICRFVTVDLISEDRAVYRGVELPVYFHSKPKTPGRRRLYLKFSMVNDWYYLTDRV